MVEKKYLSTWSLQTGKWVVVEKDELIASDKEYSKARAEAVQRGIERPFIVFVPEVEEAEFMGI